jgi:hypothetical protein
MRVIGMKLLEQVEVKLDWLDANNLHEHPVPKHKRSTNKIHVSEILRYIAVESKKLSDSDRDDEMPVCVLLGMGWEQACAKLYPNMFWQPGEVERDGIAGSPDGLSLNEQKIILKEPRRAIDCTAADIGDPIIEEFKYTKKSMRKPGGTPDEMKDICGEWLWMAQTLAYCKMHEDQPRLVRFHVLWSRGNYDYKSKGNVERYVRYLIRVENREVDANWNMILNHKDKVGKGAA